MRFAKAMPLALGAAALGRFFATARARAARAAATPPTPPKAKRVPHVVLFGAVDGENRGTNPMRPPIERDDDLFWLRDDDRKDPEILRHLEDENAHTEAHLAHLKPLTKRIYDEIVRSVQESDDDLSFPWGERFEYFVRTLKGKAYPIVCRRRRGGELEREREREEVVLDVNEVAKTLKYCSLGAFKVNDAHDVLAYSVDANGYETYEIRFKDLNTGEHLPDVIRGAAGGVSWGHADGEVYYSTQDESHRSNKVWRHAMGTAQSEDDCVFVEDDELFSVGFGRTSDGSHMLIESESQETSETRVVDLRSKPAGEATLMQPRRLGHRYYPDRRGDRWFVLTNRDGRINFDLACAPLNAPGEEHWRAVGTHPGAGDAFEWREGRTLETVRAFRDFLVLEGREDGFSAMWVLRLLPDDEIHQGEDGTSTDARGEDGTSIDASSAPGPVAAIASWTKTEWPSENCCVYAAVASASLPCVSANQNFDASRLFVAYQSLTTPKTVYAYDVASGAREVVMTTPVRGYDQNKYVTTRVEVSVRDGTRVPVSIAYRKDLRKKNGPMLLGGYGSYGVSNDPSFAREDVPLMDRGVVIAIAHVRGGGEMGRYWYEKEGKYLKKKNTFLDFVDVAEHLVTTGWTSAATLGITGRSAGGLLVGAALNMRPDLFRCAVAAVPFVDVMVSMCDSSIPLTTGEWEEWGNPNEEKYHAYMESYSPMENIRRGKKPEVLVTSGLFDPRVAYWEGAKYAARMRDAATNGAFGDGDCEGEGEGGEAPSRILLKTDMDAGHFSATDRYKRFKERAYEHAFVLDSLGLSGAKPAWAKR